VSAPPAPRPKVFGIGWAKTGTTTLGECLRLLGYDHQGQDLDLAEDLGRGDLSRILARVAQKESFEDWPWIVLYRELDAAVPGSRFVLTTRDPARVVASYRNMLRAPQANGARLDAIRRVLYGLPFPDVTDAQIRARYERHNADVRAHFRDRPGDLLVVNWERGDGWEALCAFLGHPVPAAPFPHANRGRYGSQRPGLRARLKRLAGARG
jgi:hypothetical protein